MADWLNNKSAVVTGSGRGIGKAIALALAEAGAKVVVNDVGVAVDGSGSSLSPADEVVAQIKKTGGTAIANYDSVSDFKSAERIIKSCVDSFGKIDILVNNAGFDRPRMIWNMSEEEWDAVIGVHLKGTFNCCRHAAALMKEQNSGRIINTTSSAWRGTVGHANYGAAKGGIVSFTLSIAKEMSKYNVTVNAVAPAAATRFTTSEETKKGIWKRVEAGLMTKAEYDKMFDIADPEYIAPFVVFLATNEASKITGQVFDLQAGKIGVYSLPEQIKSISRDYKKQGKWLVDELTKSVPGMFSP